MCVCVAIKRCALIPKSVEEAEPDDSDDGDSSGEICCYDPAELLTIYVIVV